MVACVLDACASPVGAPVRIYNVGSGRGTSVADLARQALEAAGRHVPLRITAQSDRLARAAVRELIAVIGQARRELRWTPSTSLEQGLA
jgi:nucleoside-diphosphate-sugar epimerase